MVKGLLPEPAIEIGGMDREPRAHLFWSQGHGGSTPPQVASLEGPNKEMKCGREAVKGKCA
jgi:hypothetical protein